MFETVFGLREHLIETWVFENVVLMVTIKLPDEIKSKRQLKGFKNSQLRPGSILIKHFRHIATTDLHMLFPKIRVVMILRQAYHCGTGVGRGRPPDFQFIADADGAVSRCRILSRAYGTRRARASCEVARGT